MARILEQDGQSGVDGQRETPSSNFIDSERERDAERKPNISRKQQPLSDSVTSRKREPRLPTI